MNLDLARAVADAVLYEGYLLYPYRASSSKNRVRWQFGVLGPPGAAEAGLGEESSMSMQVLFTELSEVGAPIAAHASDKSVVLHLRFLQLQRRQVYDGHGRPVEELAAGDSTWISWDEAVEREVTLSLPIPDLAQGVSTPVLVEGGEDVEPLISGDGVEAGSVARRRGPLAALVTATAAPMPGSGADYTRLEVRVDNVVAEDGPMTKDGATRSSLIGAHLIVEAHGVAFVSLLEPPEGARDAAAECSQHRCWPVLTGAPGDTDLVLGSPIILYDYPEIAAESAGALFDATEIDEILTLRVMTMTDQEKAEARATDPRAREIIDRCDEMTPDTLQQLHGILRNPHAYDVRNLDPPTFDTGDVPWWDPEADAAVRPELDAVTIDGVSVSKGCLVRVHPNRRADAQDLFFADQVARVTAVLSDVDGGVHVALVLVDDPAADLHDWYGRYFYFAPDEVSPLSPDEARRVTETQSHAARREESRP